MTLFRSGVPIQVFHDPSVLFGGSVKKRSLKWAQFGDSTVLSGFVVWVRKNKLSQHYFFIAHQQVDAAHHWAVADSIHPVLQPVADEHALYQLLLGPEIESKVVVINKFNREAFNNRVLQLNTDAAFLLANLQFDIGEDEQSHAATKSKARIWMFCLIHETLVHHCSTV